MTTYATTYSARDGLMKDLAAATTLAAELESALVAAQRKSKAAYEACDRAGNAYSRAEEVRRQLAKALDDLGYNPDGTAKQ